MLGCTLEVVFAYFQLSGSNNAIFSSNEVDDNCQFPLVTVFAVTSNDDDISDVRMGRLLPSCSTVALS